tara:strand:+ start:1180 stop:1347 length:168 start_codon:yes stop_codon:yes gene_type:complete
MPTYGENQTPAGIDKSKAPRKPGRRVMKSKNTNIIPTLRIDNIPYKGNAVLNANK